MESTTIKVTVATRDRIRSYGGSTHEATIVAALDALDERGADLFWAQAEQARRAHDEMSPADRALVADGYRRIDAAFEEAR